MAADAAVSAVEGALDVHVHAAPSLFARWGDAWDLAEACQAAGMAGFVLKSHRVSTVETAALLSRRFPGLTIFGGLALNAFVGGLNPVAVDAQLKVGAKVIWLPTVHAAYHGEKCGCLGGFGFQKAHGQDGPKVAGIRVVDAHGECVPALRDILHLLHGRPVVLASGHVSPEEIFALQRYVSRERLEIRLLINHVQFTVPALSIAQLRELQNPWTWFEVVQLCISPLVNSTTPAALAEYLGALPEAQWVLASDSGQKANKRCPEALQELGEKLVGAGVAAPRVRRMMCQEPRRLLALE